MDTNTASTVPSDTEVTARVEALLAQMSLAEKIGQLTQIGGADFIPGPKPEDIIRRGGAGSVLWLNDTKKFNALQKIAVEESPSKIPLLFALDVIHGYRTVFPVPLAMASSWDPSAIYPRLHDSHRQGRRGTQPAPMAAVRTNERSLSGRTAGTHHA